MEVPFVFFGEEKSDIPSAGQGITRRIGRGQLNYMQGIFSEDKVMSLLGCQSEKWVDLQQPNVIFRKELKKGI